MSKGKKKIDIFLHKIPQNNQNQCNCENCKTGSFFCWPGCCFLDFFVFSRKMPAAKRKEMNIIRDFTYRRSVVRRQHLWALEEFLVVVLCPGANNQVMRPSWRKLLKLYSPSSSNNQTTWPRAESQAVAQIFNYDSLFMGTQPFNSSLHPQLSYSLNGNDNSLVKPNGSIKSEKSGQKASSGVSHLFHHSLYSSKNAPFTSYFTYYCEIGSFSGFTSQRREELKTL